VPALLAAGGGIAIVLERIARGAGATRWYGLLGEEQFDALLESLSPGSRVSFYFDGRIAVARFGEDVAEDVLRVAADDHDAVLGVFTPDGREMVVELIAGPPGPRRVRQERRYVRVGVLRTFPGARQ
jgi:hypothetical protein